VAQKSYVVLQQAMVELGRHAIARVVMHGKEQVVWLRPMDDLLSMTVLNYDHEIAKPSAFEEELVKPTIAADELKLAKTLIEASTSKNLDYAKYKDLYTEKLTQLIEAKVAGRDIVAAPIHEQAQIINLMDALRQSVAKVEKSTPVSAPTKPPKKMAASRKPEKGAVEKRARKRKSG
jgi:DNA end-binding protein Ku